MPIYNIPIVTIPTKNYIFLKKLYFTPLILLLKFIFLLLLSVLNLTNLSSTIYPNTNPTIIPNFSKYSGLFRNIATIINGISKTTSKI